MLERDVVGNTKLKSNDSRYKGLVHNGMFHCNSGEIFLQNIMGEGLTEEEEAKLF